MIQNAASFLSQVGRDRQHRWVRLPNPPCSPSVPQSHWDHEEVRNAVETGNGSALWKVLTNGREKRVKKKTELTFIFLRAEYHHTSCFFCKKMKFKNCCQWRWDVKDTCQEVCTPQPGEFHQEVCSEKRALSSRSCTYRFECITSFVSPNSLYLYTSF